MLYTLSMETEINFNRKFRLKNYTLPIVVIGLAIQQYFAPHRAWEILLAAFGGALVLSSIWAFVL